MTTPRKAHSRRTANRDATRAAAHAESAARECALMQELLMAVLTSAEQGATPDGILATLDVPMSTLQNQGGNILEWKFDPVAKSVVLRVRKPSNSVNEDFPEDTPS